MLRRARCGARQKLFSPQTGWCEDENCLRDFWTSKMLGFLRAVIRNYGALPKHAASGWHQQDVDSYRLRAKSQLHAEVARGAVHDQNGPRCLSSQRTPTCWHKKLLQKHLRLMPAKAR